MAEEEQTSEVPGKETMVVEQSADVKSTESTSDLENSTKPETAKEKPKTGKLLTNSCFPRWLFLNKIVFIFCRSRTDERKVF